MKPYAEKYNEIGWLVMPIRPNTKVPLLKSWSKITSNEQTLDKFEDDSNIGIIMGKNSGIICIDVDVKSADGVATLKELENKYGKLPSTVTSETPSGGIHYYFRYHEGIRNRKKVGPGIDIQADGTQTVEAPSTIDGMSYEWVYDPFEYEVEELPKAWLDFLCDDNKGEDTVILTPPPFEAPTEVKEGSRNNTLASYVGSMLGKKLKKSTVLKKALTYNQGSCDPPLDDEEVEQIVNSMIKTDINNKRETVERAINPNSEEARDKIDWLVFDETGTPSIDEQTFAQWYIEKNQIYCINKRFFTTYGLRSDGWFENDIQNIIGGIVKTKLAAKVQDLLKVVKNECYMEAGAPDPYKLQFENIAFDVSDGKLEECDEFFTLHRIPHKYDKDADCPVWKKFMSELLYEEDIPVVQEYLGYCLIPNTLAQTALFVVGEGGEGKSRITIMMEHILGENSVVVGDFKGLQDRFSLSSLDNQMLFIDDDISLDALDDTSNFKKIVTAETALEVEAKGVPKYKSHLYSKIFCCGNGAVQSKFDHTDGFYRRLLVAKVRPLDNARKPDRRLIEKMKEETSGIINWLLEGLLRVVNKGFIITPSHRMEEQVQNIRDNADTIAQFFNDEQYVECTYDSDDGVSMKDMYDAYEYWCQENMQVCLSKTTFSKRSRLPYMNQMRKKAEDIPQKKLDGMLSKERMYIDKKQVRGFCGIKLLNYTRSFTVRK